MDGKSLPSQGGKTYLSQQAMIFTHFSRGDAEIVLEALAKICPRREGELLCDLCDVMGDYFDACEGELTMNEVAVKKQMTLIDELHKCGAEVLMSSHVCKFTPAERVLEIARQHERRGADICKIVTGAKDMTEQIENLRIINLLKENLSIPFLFLAGGECKIVRRIGGELGNCMSLCVHEYDEFSTNLQPLLSDMKIIREIMKG